MQKKISGSKRKFCSDERNIENGRYGTFIKLVEHEALTLHAMMMMSDPAFILMKTGTLEVINKIWDFRKETGLLYSLHWMQEQTYIFYSQ
jgi:diphosphomevalonate decarboxylase